MCRLDKYCTSFCVKMIFNKNIFYQNYKLLVITKIVSTKFFNFHFKSLRGEQRKCDEILGMAREPQKKEIYVWN